MDAIIESLKARRARTASMLNPGLKSGSGNSSLLNSASLHPQLGFRRMTASFSVNRPVPTVLRENSISSFSSSARTKYANGQTLLHIHPVTSSQPVAARTPISMPLPVSGGVVSNVDSASPVSTDFTPSSPMSAPTRSSYPPQSERRPVKFEKSDGPSDIEKRIMAAKKQKQEQEAKKRGPDRRTVRTERIEMPSNSSGHVVNRAFDGQLWAESNQKKTNDKSGIKRKNILSAPENAKSDTTVQREFTDSVKENAVYDVHDPVRKQAVLKGNNSPVEQVVQREKGAEDIIEVPAGEVEQPPVMRTFEPSIPQAEQRVEKPGIAEMKKADPLPVRKETDRSSIQREIRHADPMPAALDISRVIPAETITDEPVIEREIKKTELINNPPNSSQDLRTGESSVEPPVQREIKRGEPVRSSKESPEVVPSVQREINIAENTNNAPDSSNLPSASGGVAAPSVQREVKRAEPVVRSDEIQKTVPVNENLAKPSVQREPVPEVQAQKTAGIPEAVPVQKETQNTSVQREVQNAEPVKPGKAVPEVNSLDHITANRAVQREIKQAEPVKAASMVPEAYPAEYSDDNMLVQREIQQAEPVSASEAAPTASVPTNATVQRRPAMPFPASVQAKASQETDEIQREVAFPGSTEKSQGASSDIAEMLKNLPSHYEMPKEQIEAIKSGREYKPLSPVSASASASNVSQAEPVQREMLPGAQFVFPKQPKSGEAASSQTNTEEPHQSEKTNGSTGTTGEGIGSTIPSVQRSFAAPNPMISPFAMNYSYGNPFNVVQREPLEEENETQPRTDVNPQESRNDVGNSSDNTDSQSVEDKVDQLLPEVKAAQLDALADRLVPRIKRIMRAEMERNIFR